MMDKRLAIIILFLFSMTGLKAQTYCFHYYKHFDKMGVPEPRDGYEYITIKGDLLYVSEKDGSYKIGNNGERDRTIYKYLGEKVDGCFYYGMYDSQLMEGFDPLGLGQKLYRMFYYLVPADKSILNKVTRFDNGDTSTNCYEQCPDKNCEKPTKPNTPPIKR